MAYPSSFFCLLALAFVFYRLGCFVLRHLFRKCPVCRKNRLTNPLPFKGHKTMFFWCNECGVLAYHVDTRRLLFSTGRISVTGDTTTDPSPLKFLSGIKGKVGVRVDTHMIDIYQLPTGSDINDHNTDNVFVSTRSACIQGDGTDPNLYLNKTLGLITKEGERYYTRWY